MKLRVALLWHMHQPMYTDPSTGEAILPWVRLHATHAYTDMAAMLERHPQVRATVNFVPSLVEQLEAAARGDLRERYLDATRQRPEEMTAEQRAFIVRQHFMADHELCVKPYPRYRELLERRDRSPQSIDLTSFGAQDIRDLQLWFNLTWMGFAARAEEPDVAALIAKGTGFDEQDKQRLLDAQQRIVRGVLPRWGRLAREGRVELSTTPYYHPILPLLCDSDAARRAMPDATLPPRFSWPQDAHAQVRLALARHEQAFGVRPAGMWPAEGSLSPEALEVLAGEGVRWVATDEGNLFRSQPTPAHRGALYQPFSCQTTRGEIALGFRDRALSDRIGFTYAKLPPDDAVRDFHDLLKHAEREARAARVAHPTVFVILDGENAWERYPGKGEAFLDGLYRMLGAEFETVTMSDALAKPTGQVTRIHSGSWIESNYRIWISHPEDNLGWELLGQVRALVAKHEAAGDVAPERIEQAKRLLYSAEGSDWFWWYGDDFSTDNAAEFDALFRERLRQAAALVGETAPPRVSEPISSRARAQGPRAGPILPTALVHPTIDGRADAYAEWLGAGRLRPSGGQGAMFQGESILRSLYFGCDLEHLFVRVDVPKSLVGSTLRVSVNGRDVDIEIHEQGHLAVPLERARGAFDELVELALPLASLGLNPRERIELAVAIRRGDAEVERLPRTGSVSFEVPDADYERRHWIV